MVYAICFSFMLLMPRYALTYKKKKKKKKNWSILNMLTFEPLYDPLMAFYYIAFFYHA